jgi:hypothetical protein
MARGISRSPNVPALAGAFLVAGAASAESLLLVGDSNGDKFWAFSAVTGALVSDNYIPDDGQMAQPRQCVRVPSGTWYIGEPGVGLGCSASDGVIEHSAPGVFVRRVQDQSTGICDVNAICVRDGKVWIGRGDSVVNPAGGLSGIYSMNLDGTGLAVVSRPPTMGCLRGMAPVPGGFVVSDYSTSAAGPANRLLKISTDGQSVTVFHQPEAGGMTFPQQVSPLPDGGVVVAAFSGNPGLYFFNADGTPGTPAYYRTQGPTWTVISPRGCYPLENGKVLYAGGTVVGVVDPVMQEEFIIVNAVSPTGTAIANFSAISRIDIAQCPADFNDDGSVDGNDLGFLLASWGASGGPADLNGDGSVDGNDLGSLLAAWGPCPG